MFEANTCDNCNFHEVFWDEIDGELYHDGCLCTHPEAKKQGKLGLHFECCNSQKLCPYKEEQIFSDGVTI